MSRNNAGMPGFLDRIYKIVQDVQDKSCSSCNILLILSKLARFVTETLSLCDTVSPFLHSLRIGYSFH